MARFKPSIPDVLPVSPINVVCPFCRAQSGHDCATTSGGVSVVAVQDIAPTDTVSGPATGDPIGLASIVELGGPRLIFAMAVCPDIGADLGAQMAS